MVVFGSIHPIKPENIKSANKNTDRPMRIRSDLNIFSEPSLPPFTIPINAEPRLNKITTMIAITI